MRARMFQVGGLIVLLSLWAATVQAATGRTAGTFDVSAEGAATYSIPIWTPSGPQDVQPSLALVYNSLGRNGAVGVGWSLAGLSSIERCNLTAAQDGRFGEVLLGPMDRFCWNGNRLRMTSGATYGAAGTTYQTEVADFSVITANGVLSTGPLFFTIVTKAGLTLEFGNTSDSRVQMFQGGASLRWMLNKVSDRNGNSYTITYQTQSGVSVPTTMAWGPTAAGATTYNHTAVFTYIDKPSTKDWSSGYVAGYETISRKRLESISIRYAGTTVRKYALTYDVGPTTELSRLTRVQECNDEALSDCYLPTLITYQAGQGVSGSATTGVGATTTLIGKADFDGDGKDDLIYTTGSQWFVRFGANGGLGAAVLVNGLTGTPSTVDYDRFLPNGRAAFIANISGSLYSFSATDTNNDGVFEFNGAVSMGMTFPAGQVPTGIGGGTGKASLFWIGQDPGVPSDRVQIRANITPANGTSPVFDTQGGGRSLPLTTPDGGTLNQGAARVVGSRGLERIDVDGDGYSDFYITIPVTINQAAGRTYRALVRKGGLDIAPFATWVDHSLSAMRTPIDFNDDACTDFGDSAGVYISKCNDTAAATVAHFGAVKWLDWDGDGRTDQLVDNGGTLGVHRSTGSGFMPLVGTSIPSTGPYTVADLDGDRMDDLAAVDGSSIRYYTHTSNPGAATLYATHIPDLAATITDGFGLTYTPDYVSTGQNNYSRGADTAAPLSATKPRVVVARARFPDGAGGTYTRTYNYVGSREDTSRGTFVGFQERNDVDSRTNFTTRSTHKQLFPYTGQPIQTEILKPDGNPVARSIFTSVSQTLDFTANNQRYFVYASEFSEESYEIAGSLNGQRISTATTTLSDIDFTYGNARTTTKTITDNDPNSPDVGKQWVTTTTNTFAPATALCTDMVTRTTIAARGGDDPNTITYTVDYIPDPAQPCRAQQQVALPDSEKYRVDTTYGYDAFGNVSSISVQGRQPGVLETDPYSVMAPRTTSLNWGATGVLLARVTDAEGFDRILDYYFDRGLIRSTTDANGLTTQWQYDAFGRITRETRPDGTATTWAYNECAGAACFSGNHRTSLTKSELDTNGGVLRDDITYIDRFDRPLVTRSRMVDGAYRWSETQYDPLGRMSKEGVPCIASSAASSCVSYWGEAFYDPLGRVSQVRRPVSALDSTLQTTNFTYAGRATTVTDPQGRETSRITDVIGNLRRTTDANNYSQDFLYNSAGGLTAVFDSNQQVLFAAMYEYGIDLFQILSFDLASGIKQSVFNSLGEVQRWYDAKGQAFSATYDSLGRVTSRVDPDATTTFVFGTSQADRNRGRIQSVTSTGGGTYSESFGYDGYGRLARRTIAIPGDTSYTYDYAYHSVAGTLDTLTYPVSTSNYRLQLKYNYQNGVLRSISDAAASSTVYWSLLTANARGQITQDQLGSGIVRTRGFDAVTGRLVSIQAGPAGNTTALQNASFLYDLVGNVTQRQNNRLGLTENFFYGGPGDNLYRLRDVTLQSGSTTTTTLSLTYDSLGNILTKTDLGGTDATVDQTVAWTSFNSPATVSAATGEFTSFSYGPGRQRWKMVYQLGSTTETTYYVGGLMEKVVTAAGADYRHYIRLGDDPIAIYSRKSSGTNDLRYVLSDRLNSVDSIVSSGGVSLVTESFTPYGNRRDASDWSGPPTSGDRTTMDGVTRQGYTFHTTLGSTGLNHMGGRLQDAITGRFLSPDPYVMRPENTQGFNRYSYVINNPMTYTDPSGFDFDDCCGGGYVIIIGGGSDDRENFGPNIDYGYSLLEHYGGYRGYLWAVAGIDTGKYDCHGTFEYCDRGWVAYREAQATPPPPEPGSEFDSRRVESTVRTTASIGVGFVPIVGSGQSVVELISGKDYITGEKASRTLAAVGIVAGLAPFGKGLVKAGAKAFDSLLGSGRAGVTLYHGTSVPSALKLLSGEALDAGKAAALKIDGPPGFFLATHVDDAAYFAARREGTILEYTFSVKALDTLALKRTPLGPLGKFGRFDGDEVIVPTDMYRLFDELKDSGEILLKPYKN